MPMLAEVYVDSDSVDAIEAAISGLAAQSTVELHDHPGELPSLYDAAARGLVVYRKEDPDAQTWLTPSQTLSRGWGDCKHFSAWRVAELRNQGRKAMVRVVDRRDAEHPGRFHAVVEHDDGEIEDPSLIVIALERKGAAAIAGAEPMKTEIKIKEHKSGRGYVGSVSVPVHRHRMVLACVGDTKAEALDRSAGLAMQLAQDPILAALMPPQATVAIAAAKAIASAARSGTLDQIWDQITGPGKKRLAKVLADEYEDITGIVRDKRSTSDSVGASDADYIKDKSGAYVYAKCVDPRTGLAVPGCTPANWQTTNPGSSGVRKDRSGNPIGTGPVIPTRQTVQITSLGPGIQSTPHLTPTSSPTSSTPPPAPAPYVDPYTGLPIGGGYPPPYGSPYGVPAPANGQPQTQDGYVWIDDGAGGGHWERARAGANANAPDPMDPAGYYDPNNPQGYAAGWPPPSPNYPYDWQGQAPYGYAPPYIDPWLYPGQQPFNPGWNPANPAAATSWYPPPFEGGDGGPFAPLDASSAWYTQPGAEALFNGGVYYPSDENPGNWPAAYWPQGFVSDVGDATMHEGRAELLECARKSGALGPRAMVGVDDPHGVDDLADVADVGDMADVSDVADVGDME